MLSTMLLASLFAAGCVPLRATAASVSAFLPRSSVPTACQFPLGRENDFGYRDQSYASGRDTCVGWGVGTPACGPWSTQQQGDAMNAVTQQLAKDGQFETSTVGIWTASFGTFTTAFSNRDPMFFDAGFQDSQKSDANGGAGALTYYYMDVGNFLTLTAAHC